ncbi:MAG: Spx/MgsR family RNA polymerase-binding regulatory protein [Bifidobacteriaceae bacterium]|jgi:arsenate reductase|nr:Spx/MgsR family RNA polymerase-binding regulatory protein [Bifidobacteriaceae bacterium]MCI1978756.1 Spx/MgsR family RNA polymerase-binding regulatory protein [Bifidobacteriaceae bacterium]
MTNLLVQLSTCSSSAKARAWLNENGIDYVTRDVRKEQPTYAELAAWYVRSGVSLRRWFNVTGTAYRERGLKNLVPTMSTYEALETLASDGMLIKRPVFVGSDCVLVGFKATEWEKNLLK